MHAPIVMQSSSSTSSRLYTYEKISDLKEGKKINVIGVVQYFWPPSKSHGTSFSCTIGIVDETSTVQPLKCNLHQMSLPESCSNGDIICLRRCIVVEFEGKLQLKGFGFTTWLLFKGVSNDPETLSSNATITAVERSRVQELRDWWRQFKSQGSGAPSHTTNVPPGPLFVSQKTLALPITSLSALTADKASVAVCGIVQYFKPVTHSRGKDYYISMGVLDQTSTNQAISCTIFSPFEHQLLYTVPVGYIVLLKGLKTNIFQGRIQTRGHEHSIIGVFQNTLNEPIPELIGNWYQLNDREKKAILGVKIWSHKQGIHLINTQLCQFSAGHYLNIICRVAAVHTCVDDNRVIIEVFDGTTPRLSCQHTDMTQGNWVTACDRQLSTVYSSMLCEIQLNDWHDPISLCPGQYVCLSNVLIKPLSQGQSEVDYIQLTVSPKQNCGAIKVFDGTEPENIKRYLADFPEPCGPFPVFIEPLCMIPKPLFQIINEEMKQSASVAQVLQSSIGNKSIIEGQIMCMNYGPVEELCQLRCSVCRTRYVTPSANDPPLPAKMTCIFCSDSKKDDPLVSFVYAFVLHLRDQTGSLDICVTADDAETFFQDIPPTNLYTDRSTRNKLLQLLYIMTGWNDPFYPVPSEVDYERPYVKCCVETFVSNIDGKTRYSLIDTVCLACV